MKRYAVIGHPVGHSLSPLMQNTAFRSLGIDAQYEMIDIAPHDLEQKLHEFRGPAWGGFNITSPHKSSVLPYLDGISQEAEAAQAVNAVCNMSGLLVGANTDILGFRQSLDPFLGDIVGNPCTLLGSGGAAAAVLFILITYIKPQHINLIARTRETAEALLERFHPSAIPINLMNFAESNLQTIIKQSSIIINSTTAGMLPRHQETPLPGIHFHKDQIVYDLIYRPRNTCLLQQAKSDGAQTIGGLEMFIHQGAAAFQLWTGKQMPIPKIRQVLEEALSS